VVVTTDLDSFVGLLSQELSPREAAASGRVQLDGDEAALERFVEIFAWPPPVTLTAG
jgi:putative sterol carrier protein